MSLKKTQYLMASALGLLAVIGALIVALVPPHFEVSFTLPATVSSIHGKMVLEEMDLILEPGEFSRFEDFEKFYERQGILFKIISAPEIKVHQGSSEVGVSGRARDFEHLPPLLWMQIAVGLGAYLISAWVYFMRGCKEAGLFFFLGGVCVFLASVAAAVYTTRELALPETVFRTLAFLNALGGGGFGIAILGLFLVFPQPLPRWKLLFCLQALFFGTWLACFLFQWTWVNLNLGIVVQLGGIILLMAWQFWRAQDSPRTRASITWLGLSIVFGGGAFIVFNTIPIILEIKPLDQSYAFVFILILFLGVAAALTEFNLYRSRRWIFRATVISTVVVAFLLVDLGFFYVLKMGRWPSLGLSFVLSFVFYLPMREALARYLRIDF